MIAVLNEYYFFELDYFIPFIMLKGMSPCEMATGSLFEFGLTVPFSSQTDVSLRQQVNALCASPQRRELEELVPLFDSS